MELKDRWVGFAFGGIMLILGIALLFFEQTKMIAPFLIGFGVGKSMSS